MTAPVLDKSVGVRVLTRDLGESIAVVGDRWNLLRLGFLCILAAFSPWNHAVLVRKKEIWL